jgi:hypothetical protein
MTAKSLAILRAILVACAVASAHCVRAQETFTPDQKGCKVGNPSPKPNESVHWTGECVDGYADGKGLLQWYVDGAKSTRYEGSLHHGLLSGEGKLVMPNGASYEGQWLAGKQEGRGVQTMPDGSRYEGQWKNGVPNGHGRFRNTAGETLEGEWSEGAFVGEEQPDK